MQRALQHSSVVDGWWRVREDWAALFAGKRRQRKYCGAQYTPNGGGEGKEGEDVWVLALIPFFVSSISQNNLFFLPFFLFDFWVLTITSAQEVWHLRVCCFLLVFQIFACCSFFFFGIVWCFAFFHQNWTSLVLEV